MFYRWRSTPQATWVLEPVEKDVEHHVTFNNYCLKSMSEYGEIANKNSPSRFNGKIILPYAKTTLLGKR